MHLNGLQMRHLSVIVSQMAEIRLFRGIFVIIIAKRVLLLLLLTPNSKKCMKRLRLVWICTSSTWPYFSYLHYNMIHVLKGHCTIHVPWIWGSFTDWALALAQYRRKRYLRVVWNLQKFFYELTTFLIHKLRSGPHVAALFRQTACYWQKGSIKLRRSKDHPVVSIVSIQSITVAKQDKIYFCSKKRCGYRFWNDIFHIIFIMVCLFKNAPENVWLYPNQSTYTYVWIVNNLMCSVSNWINLFKATSNTYLAINKKVVMYCLQYVHMYALM